MGTQSSRLFGTGRRHDGDDYELISETGSNDSEPVGTVSNTILQFTSTVYYVEENEHDVAVSILYPQWQN